MASSLTSYNVHSGVSDVLYVANVVAQMEQREGLLGKGHVRDVLSLKLVVGSRPLVVAIDELGALAQLLQEQRKRS